ncbi:MAG: hypothetical protein GX227_06700 [Clostridiaceae bacterium]|jgi:type II secretory pathway component PulC|nr:hypothetical protein [Clostridiaceae bacterium]
MVRKTKNDSALKKFFNENKSLTFLLPLLAILVVVVIIVYSGMGKDKNTVSKNSHDTSFPIDTNQPQVEVLPKIIRSGSEEKIDVDKDPFSEPMKLVGVIFSESRSTAIIEWGYYSYIVEKGELVGDSDWKVAVIEKDKITLETDSDRIVLSLDGSID